MWCDALHCARVCGFNKKFSKSLAYPGWKGFQHIVGRAPLLLRAARALCWCRRVYSACCTSPISVHCMPWLTSAECRVCMRTWSWWSTCVNTTVNLQCVIWNAYICVPCRSWLYWMASTGIDAHLTQNGRLWEWQVMKAGLWITWNDDDYLMCLAGVDYWNGKARCSWHLRECTVCYYLDDDLGE